MLNVSKAALVAAAVLVGEICGRRRDGPMSDAGSGQGKHGGAASFVFHYIKREEY